MRVRNESVVFFAQSIFMSVNPNDVVPGQSDEHPGCNIREAEEPSVVTYVTKGLEYMNELQELFARRDGDTHPLATRRELSDPESELLEDLANVLVDAYTFLLDKANFSPPTVDGCTEKLVELANRRRDLQLERELLDVFDWANTTLSSPWMEMGLRVYVRRRLGVLQQIKLKYLRHICRVLARVVRDASPISRLLTLRLASCNRCRTD